MSSAKEPGRKFIRYASVFWGSEVNVTVGKNRVRAEIVDESLGGLGVRIAASLNVQVDQKVQVDNGTLCRWARVCNVRNVKDGKVRIGLEWLPDSDYV